MHCRIVILLCLGCLTATAHAQVNSAAKQIFPLEVELTRSIHAGSLHAGDLVQGKLKADWTDGSCTLLQSSVLSGVVLQAPDGADGKAGLALDFRYRCKGADAQRLVWLALLAPDPDINDPANRRVMGQAVSSANFGHSSGGLGASGNEGIDNTGKGNGHLSPGQDMSGRQNPTLPVQFAESEAARRERRPDAVKTGEVWKMPQLHLDVGTGPEGSSLLSSTEKEVKLPLGTVLILLPESVAVLKPGASGAAGNGSGALSSRRGDFRLSPENPACIGPGCASLEAAMGGTAGDGHAPGTLSEKAKHIPPISLELVRSLNSSLAKVGDEVIAKVQVDWTDGVCRFPAASVLHGVVMDTTEPGGKRGKIAMEFRYKCKGADPQKLVWLAMLAPDPGALDASDHRVMRQGFHSASFGEGGGLGKPGNTEGAIDMSGRQNATLPVTFHDSEAELRSKRPDAVKTGQVWKMPRLKLDVGAGPEGSTVVLSLDKQVKLPMGTVLILLPESVAVIHPEGGGPELKGRAPAKPKPVPVPLPPELASCAAPACTVDGASSLPASIAAETAPLRTISLVKTGYRRLKSAEMQDLEFGAASAFLGEDHLLFAFDPHSLVTREKGDRPEDQPHMVRAVIFNLKTGKEERKEEWRVHHSGQYLWVVDGSHVVVHDGDRLRWLGSGLHEERAFKLDGPLAWFRMSPDRKHFAVGTVQELHTKEEHADLAKSDAAGPEEQVRVQILNAKLETEEDGQQSSRALPPELLNGGRLELRRTQHGHWYLREHPWTPGNPRDFARVNSSCMPKLHSLSANLVAAEGCEGASNDHWYRVFREDGQPVLKGVVHWREFSPETADDTASGIFALAVPEGGGTYVRDSAFHGADLARETVRVHRPADGQEVFAMRMHAPLPAHQPVALSLGGDRLAVIDGDEIAVYRLGRADTKVAAK